MSYQEHLRNSTKASRLRLWPFELGPVEEYFPSMSEALGSNPRPHKKGTGVQAVCVYTQFYHYCCETQRTFFNPSELQIFSLVGWNTCSACLAMLRICSREPTAAVEFVVCGVAYA